jgi:uncharacterized membrane protein YccF (DUF307 family)
LKKAIRIGGAVTGLGWVAASMASNLNVFTIIFGIAGGIGIGILYGIPIENSEKPIFIAKYKYY